MGVLARLLGGTLGSYIMLHVILLAYRKHKHHVQSILQAAALTLAAAASGSWESRSRRWLRGRRDPGLRTSGSASLRTVASLKMQCRQNSRRRLDLATAGGPILGRGLVPLVGLHQAGNPPIVGCWPAPRRPLQASTRIQRRGSCWAVFARGRG